MTALDIEPTALASPEPIEEGVAGARWRVLDRLEKTGIGRRGAGGVVTVRRREPAGCVLFGPYWQLPAGNYRLNFRCRSGTPRMPGQPVLGVEVIAMNRVQLAWLDLTAEELSRGTGSLEFTVPPALGLGAGDEARLEFRFFHLANADLAISTAVLDRMQEGEIRDGVPRRWRLLGRLEASLAASRSVAGISVRRAARPGRVLDSGRSLLQLPRGHYRLAFRGAAGTARMPSQPVLGVEIVASRRWRAGRFRDWGSLFGLPGRAGVQLAWADFTESELRDGSGAVEFFVPAELSLEGGQDINFGVGFTHLGNADLTISAVELQQTVRQAGSPAPPGEWRLLGRLAKGAIGVRGADGVTARQNEPAGTLVYGGRPDLRLSAGRYRLTLRCDAGVPQSASQPVLAAEVLACKRSLLRPRALFQLRRDFTSEALQSGSAVIDFDVPPELSRESEQDVRFKFSVRHLANADLTISEVNLRRLGQPPDDRLRVAKAKRAKILIVGNCQAQTVHEAFVRTGALNERFDARYHFVGLQNELHELGRSELDSCEVLLVQDIKDWENYPLRAYIPDGIRIVKFPLLHFASLWPFDHYNGPGDKDAYEREWPNLAFLYHDGLLARLRKEIPDPKQRLQAYRELSVDGVINYVRLHDFERRRLVAMDQQFGLKIGQYILDNFQKRQLFYTTNHPNGRVTAMLMQYLLGHLGVSEIHPSASSLDHLKRLQVPVHPKVAQALGVRWADERTKYLYGGERITWEAYMRRYIDHYG
jgi:hypothetical protein